MTPLEIAARVFDAHRSMIEETLRGKVPAEAYNYAVDGYEQLAWAFRHDDPSHLHEKELLLFSAVRDRVLNDP